MYLSLKQRNALSGYMFIAIWVVGMSALAAALLVVGDVSPPFAPAVSTTDTPAATEDQNSIP